MMIKFNHKIFIILFLINVVFISAIYISWKDSGRWNREYTVVYEENISRKEEIDKLKDYLNEVKLLAHQIQLSEKNTMSDHERMKGLIESSMKLSEESGFNDQGNYINLSMKMDDLIKFKNLQWHYQHRLLRLIAGKSSGEEKAAEIYLPGLKEKNYDPGNINPKTVFALKYIKALDKKLTIIIGDIDYMVQDLGRLSDSFFADNAGELNRLFETMNQQNKKTENIRTALFGVIVFLLGTLGVLVKILMRRLKLLVTYLDLGEKRSARMTEIVVNALAKSVYFIRQKDALLNKVLTSLKHLSDYCVANEERKKPPILQPAVAGGHKGISNQIVPAENGNTDYYKIRVDVTRIAWEIKDNILTSDEIMDKLDKRLTVSKALLKQADIMQDVIAEVQMSVGEASSLRAGTLDFESSQRQLSGLKREQMHEYFNRLIDLRK